MIIDCLTLWTSNALDQLGADEARDHAKRAAMAARRRIGQTIVVSKEVGLGLVPCPEIGDTLGAAVELGELSILVTAVALL